MTGVSVACILVIISADNFNANLEIALKLFVVAIPLVLGGALIEHRAFGFPDEKIGRTFTLIGRVLAVLGDLIALIGFFLLVKNKSESVSWLFLASIVVTGIIIAVSGYTMNKREKN